MYVYKLTLTVLDTKNVLEKLKLWILDDNSDENEALEFGSDDYGSDGSQDEEDVSFMNFHKKKFWILQLLILWIFFILNSTLVFFVFKGNNCAMNIDFEVAMLMSVVRFFPTFWGQTFYVVTSRS